MRNTKYELLAPVGDFRTLHAAIEAGADAVYFGIKGLNMRDTARNFNIKDLKKIREICKNSERNVKMYLTLNVVIYDEELKKVENIIKKIKGKVDAVICWDLAVVSLCRKYKIPFHVSTQASVSNSLSAGFFKELGAERIVLARELNLKQIKKVSKIIPIECFCHGAMCVAISGRCFMSQYTHGNKASANRGRCAHLCRRTWKITDDGGNDLLLENSRVMSAKDLCTLPFIDEMKKAGITSFKIEGRNRSPEYVYTVVSEYKKALEKRLTRKEIKEALENLKRVYNKGFSSGFYLKMPTADDFACSDNGEQTEYKEFVGKVEKYWPKAKAASVKMSSGQLKINDEVYLISDKENLKRAKVKSIELEGKPAKTAVKGQEIGVDFGVEVKRGCEVYLIKKRE